ncbi:lanthionine synthetase C family protein [Kitasatospora sp. NBC_01246]|uniref:lanthionine synthetase C family protein n=1 Tax=Kitasatospora sp. NBC_01246 TaxID=2903570 RepID=UPI002E334E56|nr:lanthionine synthetase C family protein [Kitasatospora sp. NBC_01246]
MTAHPAQHLAVHVADRLAEPEAAPAAYRAKDWWRQSLAHGIPGIALLHIELAARGLRPWQRAHDWLAATARAPVTSGPDSHPFHGAPALAHALACAAEHLPGSYQRPLHTLDQQLAADTRRRLDAAHRRIDDGQPPALAEFDAIHGLTGYGARLLHRDPDSDVGRAVLEYLVRLAEPLTVDGRELPGWWTLGGPSGRPDTRFPGGHANTGAAHGITGPLLLLSRLARHGITVPGQLEGISTVLAWLDRWRQDTDRGPAWPYWITPAELRTDRAAPNAPLRPSWCYGTAGVGRAQQLAAIALGDRARQLAAENALADALTDPAQLAATTDISLCHGFAGLAHIAARAAHDALPETAPRLRALVPALLTAVRREAAVALVDAPDAGPGLLDGAAGVALATLAAGSTDPPRSAWDACLLIS